MGGFLHGAKGIPAENPARACVPFRQLALNMAYPRGVILFISFPALIAIMAWKIDEIDRKLLELLREDARTPNEKLGKKVGLSEPAARRRVSNLVSRGVIRRFTVDIEESGSVQAIVFLSTAPHANAEKLSSKLSGHEGIGFIWETSGDMDLAVLLSAPDMGSLNKRIDLMRAMEEVTNSKTSIVMKKWR